MYLSSPSLQAEGSDLPIGHGSSTLEVLQAQPASRMLRPAWLRVIQTPEMMLFQPRPWSNKRKVKLPACNRRHLHETGGQMHRCALGGGLQLVAAVLQRIRPVLQRRQIGSVLSVGRSPLRLRLRQGLVQHLPGNTQISSAQREIGRCLLPVHELPEPGGGNRRHAAASATDCSAPCRWWRW